MMNLEIIAGMVCTSLIPQQPEGHMNSGEIEALLDSLSSPSLSSFLLPRAKAHMTFLAISTNCLPLRFLNAYDG